MKGIFFILLIVSSEVFATAPNCARLQELAGYYEQKLQRSTVQNCTTETLPQMNLSPAQTELVRKMQCFDLNSLEARAKKLENELALIGGFQVLKNDIRDSKRAVERNTNNTIQSAESFRKSLQVANDFDLFLNTPGDPILRQLKNIPVDRRSTVEKLMTEVRQLCNGRAATGACTAGFTPSGDTLVELNTVLSQNTLEDSQIESMKRAMQIMKPDNTPWSFSEMNQTLNQSLSNLPEGSTRNTVMNAQIAAIRSLPEFQDVAALPFLNELRNNSSRTAINTAIEKYRFSVGDLKNRMELEVRSKISLVWAAVKSSAIALTPEQRSACELAKSDTSKARSCFQSMRDKKDTMADRDSAGKALITNAEEEYATFENNLPKSFSYLDSFAAVETCLRDRQVMTTTPVDDQEFASCPALNNLNADLANIQSEILVVNGLRDKIAEQNRRTMNFRNYLVEKIAPPNSCASVLQSPVECDSNGLSRIAPQAYGLATDILGISLVHTSENASVETECETPRQQDHEEEICSAYDDPPLHPNAEPTPQPSDDSPYVEAPQRNLQREAVIDGLSGLATGIAGTLFAPPQNYYNPYAGMNPYMYNYNPYPYTGMMSPVDSILFNQRYYGSYGFYFPTVGASPYTAFPVSSTYIQAAIPGSPTATYFGNFGTYR